MRKLRLGMIGGGPGAFIGKIHRIAAQLDNQIELVCGAFSSDPQKSIEFGCSLYLDKSRCYGSYQEMLHQEALRQDDRIDMVAIVTPNHLHFPIAKMAIEYGFNVISDKPATLNLGEAIALEKLILKHNINYALTHTYTGYPMVKEARHRVIQGDLGKIVKIVVEYPQGWLSSKDDESTKQASWRLNPALSGISCCMADIGVHASNLAEYISGQEITEICADLNTTVDGRLLDDDGTVLLRFNHGARGVLIASQISIGEENNLNIKVYGDKASLTWSQHNPNELLMKYPNQSSRIIRSGVGELCEYALDNIRTPAGHPEGYLEAFANIYRQFSKLLKNPDGKQYDVPGIKQAIRGMAFIENTVAASQSSQKWHTFNIASPSTLAEIDNEKN
ncbi:MAG: Gfo/Idh/MocA family oxidoreductase [Colwellia sp.]|nr:Gfo/Idh/MocA family oxidoreductase [Colwellia sp.]